jgi:hypothetical protein
VLEFDQAGNIATFVWWQMEAASAPCSVAEVPTCGCFVEKKSIFCYILQEIHETPIVCKLQPLSHFQTE